ncbi:MAG: pyridoxamine 5'-phosphate oxidase family protein [Rhodospirillales bacterium]
MTQEDSKREGDSRDPAAVMFSPSVRAAQTRLGSRQVFSERERKGLLRQDITEDLAAFLAERDSCYLATASAAGQPYLQHRGGPKGFLKPLGPRLLGFADFAGNRQYVTLGHLQENPQAFLFLMDYSNRTRVKLWGRAHTIEDDPVLLRSLAVPGYQARLERALLFEVDAWDINCKQHIAPRYDEPVLEAIVAKMQQRINALEAELAALKSAR